MQVIVNITMDSESEENMEILKNLLIDKTECILDLDFIHGARLNILDDNLSKVVTGEKEFVAISFPDEGNSINKKSLVQPTVGNMIALLSDLPHDMKFCMSGLENFNLFVNKTKRYCIVDENDYVFDTK